MKMSIINIEDLQEIKRLRSAARETASYEKGYHLAVQALEKAISIIHSVQTVTKDAEIKIVIKD